MTVPRDMSGRAAWGLVLLLWLACAAVLLWQARDAISTLGFADSDDALRMVEVRDWLAGQSWFDVSQYRIQPPGGTSMHWSRLVDVPIAALMLLGGTMMPAAMAEKFAVAAIPLIVLLLAITLHLLTVRLTGRRIMGVVAAAMLMLSLSILIQFKPTRIDHHDWQILLGGLTVLLALRALAPSGRSALVAGIVAALSLTVAIEGLPLVVAVAAIFALRHVRDGKGAGLLLSYLAGLAGGGTLLLLATLGRGALVPWCDALSPAYIGPIAVALLVFAAGTRLVPQHGYGGRIATLLIAGAGAVACLRFATPVCAAGPFSNLDPLVMRLWYMSVMEGRPIWAQTRDLAMLLPLPPLIGLGAVLWAIRSETGARRDAWLAMLIVQAVTMIVSIVVMRAMGLAHLVALPANAWLVTRLFLAARGLSSPALRVLASVACIALTPLGAEALVLACLPEAANTTDRPAAETVGSCTDYARLQGLRALPPAILFAPLDIGPDILAYSRHSVLGTGHHRAKWGMKTVISGFIATPDAARTIVTATKARYFVLCEKAPEMRHYAQDYPASITSALLRHRHPAWLEPVPMPRGESIRVYRILR